MPNIRPISDLRNYTEVLKQVDRYRAAYMLFSKLKKAEERADKEGWISADELEKELGVEGDISCSYQSQTN